MSEREGWHAAEHLLRRYADGALAPPLLWSVEAHLVACAGCRQRLTTVADPAPVEAGWDRLDAELDAPPPGPIERLIIRLGAADHTARLLAATPVLRLAWLASVAVTLAMTAGVARLTDPWLFLAVAPLLPLAGVMVSFGPRADPTYELTVVAPMSTFRLLLLRCVAVLATTTVLSTAASLVLPRYGLVALGWFLPGLALTLLSLTLTPRFGPLAGAGSVGLGWLVLVTWTATGGVLVAGTAGAQVAALVTAAGAAVVLARLRLAFDRPDRFRSPSLLGPRRNS